MRLAHICPTCRIVVPARQTCPRCGPDKYRKSYNSKDYERNRIARLRMAGGRCESCGDTLVDGRWQCHHVVPLSRGGSDGIENLRVLCSWIENGKRKGCHTETHRTRS